MAFVTRMAEQPPTYFKENPNHALMNLSGVSASEPQLWVTAPNGIL